MLEFAEESLDQVALAIQREIGFAWSDAIGFGRNDRLDAPILQRLDQRVGIIALVSEECFGRDQVEQRCGLGDIGGLARR